MIYAVFFSLPNIAMHKPKSAGANIALLTKIAVIFFASFSFFSSY